ncbi:class I SAM-dependent methyltransferase [bacterium]|nr:class I SAM-dependent methyltransferase [bacterium]
MNIRNHNRDAWNRLVEKKDRWTCPVDSAEIARARKGDISIGLSPSRRVPSDWFPPLSGLKVLCPASGGGQQGPILSAAGADVTVYDNSPKQLEQDRFVAEREGLGLRTVEGDMADLSSFEDSSFEFIYHPASNCFAEDVTKVWSEAYRVLAPGGTIVAGLVNPISFLFDRELEKKGVFQLAFGMPYSDVTSLPQEKLQALLEAGEPMMFAHSFDDLIGGQLEAGFQMIGFYEDNWGGHEAIDKHFKSSFATRAVKPASRSTLPRT